MAQSPYKMKGTPMQRNFGVGEKESPAKVVGLAAAAIGAGISAAIGGGVSYLNEASDAITNTGKEKDRLV